MKVGVVSSYSISRKALCALLAAIPEVRVVLDVDDLLGNFELIQKLDPAILLVDALSPASDLEIVSKARKVFPKAKVLLLSDRADEEFELHAIKAGARGCLSKRSDPLLLARALNAVERGEIWVSHRMASRIIGEFVRSRSREKSSSDLSQREWEILALVAQGYRNKQVGHRLFICESTIKTHLYTIYKKLQIGSRLEAILYYYHHFKEDHRQSTFSPVQFIPEARHAHAEDRARPSRVSASPPEGV